MVVPTVDTMIETLDAALAVHGEEASQRRLLDAMKLKLEEYIPLVRTDLAITATVLDPRFNLDYFEGKEKERVQDVIKTSYQRLVDSTPESSSQQELEEPRGMIFKKKRVTNEIEQYFSLNTEPDNIDPISWWLDRATSLRRLHKMALDHLIIPATSVPSEQAFSNAGDVINKKRNRLGNDSIQAVICLDSWKQL